MEMIVARDITGSAGARTHSPQRLFHCREHRRMLAHAEIVVRAPDGDLGADAVIESARKPTAAPFEIGEDAVPPLGVQCIEALSEEALVIHGGPRLVAVTLAEGKPRCARRALVW